MGPMISTSGLDQRGLAWNPMSRVLGVFTGLALTLMAFPAAGQKLDKPATTIGGRVVDDQRRPISGADVWMPVRWDEQPGTTPHATSDARGNYVLKVPETWSRSPIHERRWIVWAHARNRRIGMANAWYALSGKPESLDVTLGPATDTSLVVLGPDGRRLAGAVVEPYLVLAPNNCYTNPPAGMQPAIRSVTDGTGRATLPAIAGEGFMSVKIEAASLGSQAIRLIDLGAPDGPTPPVELKRVPESVVNREIRLRPVGRVEGRIEAARREWTKGVKIYLSTAGSLGHEGGLAEVTTGDDGRFVVPAIAEGKLDVSPRLDPSVPARPRSISDVEIRGNQTTKFVLFLQKAVRIRGKIRVKGSGEPVAGASIVVSYGSDDLDPQGKERHAGAVTAVSDERGQFEAFGLPGGASTQVIALPDAFAMPPGPAVSGRQRVPDDAGSFELTPIEVVKASGS
jgi:hypothetical protein